MLIADINYKINTNIFSASLICMTSLDKAADKDCLFTIAFLILYFTSWANFNAPYQYKVELKKYMRYLIYFYNYQFS